MHLVSCPIYQQTLKAVFSQEEARVPVPDWRVDWLHQTYQSKTKIPAFLTCTDIAGLTRGANTGAGLGNAFLSHVRAVDGIFQVVRQSQRHSSFAVKIELLTQPSLQEHSTMRKSST